MKSQQCEIKALGQRYFLFMDYKTANNQHFEFRHIDASFSEHELLAPQLIIDHRAFRALNKQKVIIKDNEILCFESICDFEIVKAAFQEVMESLSRQQVVKGTKLSAEQVAIPPEHFMFRRLILKCIQKHTAQIIKDSNDCQNPYLSPEFFEVSKKINITEGLNNILNVHLSLSETDTEKKIRIQNILKECLAPLLKEILDAEKQDRYIEDMTDDLDRLSKDANARNQPRKSR